MTTSTAPAPTGRRRKAPAAPKPRSGELELTHEQALAVKALRKARRDARAAKALEDASKKTLQPLLDDPKRYADLTVMGIPVAALVDATWTGYDGDVLVNAFPEAAAAATVSKPYTAIRVA